jgi:hypothetical protein
MSEQLANVYTDAVHHNLKQYAPWPVDALIRLGDYGRIEGSQFKRIDNIATEFGIECKPVESAVNLVFEFKSAEVEEININAAAAADGGPASVSAKARATLKFAKRNSVYFRSIQLRYERIDNFAEVNQAIMRRFEEGKWRGNHAFVHDLFKSAGTTIIVSSSDGAIIEIEAGAKGIVQIDLADASAKLKHTHDLNVGLKVIAGENLVPLFGLAQIRPRFRWLPFLGGRTVQPMIAKRLVTDEIEQTSGAIPGSVVVNLKPELSPQIAKDLGKSVDEIFQVEEIP